MKIDILLHNRELCRGVLKYHWSRLIRTIGSMVVGLLFICIFIAIESPSAHLEPKIVRPESLNSNFIRTFIQIMSFNGTFWAAELILLSFMGILGAVSSRIMWIIIPALALGASLESGLLTYLLKVALSRPAPMVAIHNHIQDGFYEFRGFQLKEYRSFPSGHAAIAVTIATTLSLTTRYWRIPALLIAGYISWSRPYLGDHYWSDVVAGALIGIYFGWLGAVTIKRIQIGIVNQKQ